MCLYSGQQGHVTAGSEAARVFNLMVMCHPPHLHPEVREQYRLFLQELNSHGSFSLWEELMNALGCVSPSLSLSLSLSLPLSLFVPLPVTSMYTLSSSMSSSGPRWQVSMVSTLVDALLLDYNHIYTRYALELHTTQ